MTTDTAHNLLGILGGTFDPIHLGHLHLATEIKSRLGLSEVRLIPCYQPVHRALPIASPEDRFAMVKLAIEGYPGITVDASEIQRGGSSYMIDTLHSLRAEIKNRPLGLIMATDAFASFTKWRNWTEILELTHLLIANRDEDKKSFEPALEKLLSQHEISDAILLTSQPAGYIYFMHIAPLPIAATTIRTQIAEGIMPTESLSPKVWEYIQKHRLYGYK